MKYLYLIVLLSLVTGCSSSTPVPVTKRNSVTQVAKGNFPLKRYLHKTDRKLAKHSAFYSLPFPVDALAARLFLIDNAKRSLNVQYYIYDDDSIGRIFTAHLLLAAQRGVKVRMLLDDLTTTGKDGILQKLALHPNVELRLFNPNKLRTSFRNLAMLFNVDTLGKRMHNKSLIADGYTAIMGGRNIGDVYFAATSEAIFLDYDILCIGAVVPEISHAFDIYWNSEQVLPLSEVVGISGRDYKDFEQKLSLTLDKEVKRFEQTRLGKAISKSVFMKKVKSRKLQFTVAKEVDFYYDAPSKVASDENDNSTHISAQLRKNIKSANSSVTIISPYLIPSGEMMNRMTQLGKQGVEINIITNSLDSTDVLPVYAGYQKYIKRLLQIGINLYELKTNSFAQASKKKHLKKKPKFSLHTKMILVDQELLAIGSANMDPRSDKLNTELFMVITSKKITTEEQKILDEVLNLNNFYKLSWGPYPKMFEEDATRFGPIWTTMENGKKTIYYQRPQTGFFKRLGTDFMSLLPINGYL
jgi:putative cardiolipin synthase